MTDNPESLASHCWHWTFFGEECCECGLVDAIGDLWGARTCRGRPTPENTATPCPHCDGRGSIYPAPYRPGMEGDPCDNCDGGGYPSVNAHDHDRERDDR